jgi:hypothetical protein
MNIMITVPSYSGLIPLELMSRIMHLDLPKGAVANFSYIERCFIDKARNAAAELCVKHNNDYLLFIDDDTIPPKDILTKMIALDKDIVGCPVPNRNGKPLFAVFDEDYNQTEPPKKPSKVGAVGMSSTLIKASALKKIMEKATPFQFITMMHKDILTEFSEDVFFCVMANDLGLEVWCDPTITPEHLGKQMRYKYELS